jgi:hypothetical protein
METVFNAVILSIANLAHSWERLAYIYVPVMTGFFN